jgi:predicted phosphodiesterase
MTNYIHKVAQWIAVKVIGRPIAKVWYKVYGCYEFLERKLDTILYKAHKHSMLKLGIVGDLSMQDPDRLDKVMRAAYKQSDMVIHVGDVHAGYDVMTKYLKGNKDVRVVPGNHDESYDRLGTDRQWLYYDSLVVIVGVDNSEDKLDALAWQLLKEGYDRATKKNLFFIVVAHKPISSIMLSNGESNNHIMGESGNVADRDKFKTWLGSLNEVLFVCGHYHAWAMQETRYATVLIEGRGGAAPDLGWTQVLVSKDGMVINRIDL